MIKCSINKTKSFIPLQISKGTTEQRFQKARLFNLKFYDELQSCIKNKEIAPRTFTQKLRKVAGAKLGIFMYETESAKDSQCLYILNKKGINIGYNLGIPLAFFTKNIHTNNARTFLRETQNLFNEAFNPKILQRFITLANKGYNISSIMKFYQNNLAKTAMLNQSSLEKFLDKKSSGEKINSLQFMRYKLMSEINTAKSAYQIDRRIEKHNNFKYELAPDFYSLDKYQYEEKLKVLEAKIKQLIQDERA